MIHVFGFKNKKLKIKTRFGGFYLCGSGGKRKIGLVIDFFWFFGIISLFLNKLNPSSSVIGPGGFFWFCDRVIYE